MADYQVSAMLMAIYFRGLDRGEIFQLTKCMRDSGEVMDLSNIEGIKVDKHSTGGVGDKTTLICGPIAAACGVPVAKMSGRGLGFTGGTIDKLEAIPGFSTSLSPESFVDQVNDIGIAITGQTASVATADKKLYALRDVTGTVSNTGLIASSVMSKKLASGSNAIVLDVKCGKGAFMQTEEAAEALARIMVDIGTDEGVRTVALVTDMDQPLGKAVGNSLEVMEAIAVLNGAGPDDIAQLGVTLAGMMIYAGGKASGSEEGIAAAREAIANGSALRKLRELIAYQGGTPEITEPENFGLFKKAKLRREVMAPEDGYVSGIDAALVGTASQHSGAGREKKEDDVDLSAGIYLEKKVGDSVKKGQLIATIYSDHDEKADIAEKELLKAYTFSEKPPEKRPLIKAVID